MQTTEERIIAAATRVLADDTGASMIEVAAVTGVGRATLYRHFPNRAALIAAIRSQALRDCGAVLARAGVGDGTADEALERIVRALLPVLDRYRVLLDAPPADMSDPEQRALKEAVEGPLLEVLRRGRREGSIAAGLPEGFLYEAVSGVLRAARRAIVHHGVGPDEAADAAVRALLDGVRP